MAWAEEYTPIGCALLTRCDVTQTLRRRNILLCHDVTVTIYVTMSLAACHVSLGHGFLTSRCTPPPDVSGFELPASAVAGAEVLPNGSLVIAEVTDQHEGAYLCEANNGIGVGLSAMPRLDVFGKCRFTSLLCSTAHVLRRFSPFMHLLRAVLNSFRCHASVSAALGLNLFGSWSPLFAPGRGCTRLASVLVRARSTPGAVSVGHSVDWSLPGVWRLRVAGPRRSEFSPAAPGDGK